MESEDTEKKTNGPTGKDVVVFLLVAAGVIGLAVLLAHITGSIPDVDPDVAIAATGLTALTAAKVFKVIVGILAFLLPIFVMVIMKRVKRIMNALEESKNDKELKAVVSELKEQNAMLKKLLEEKESK